MYHSWHHFSRNTQKLSKSDSIYIDWKYYLFYAADPLAGIYEVIDIKDSGNEVLTDTLNLEGAFQIFSSSITSVQIVNYNLHIQPQNWITRWFAAWTADNFAKTWKKIHRWSAAHVKGRAITNANTARKHTLWGGRWKLTCAIRVPANYRVLSALTRLS